MPQLNNVLQREQMTKCANQTYLQTHVIIISVHTSFSIAVTQIFSFSTAADPYTIPEQGFTTWVTTTFCLNNSFWGVGGVGAEHTQVQAVPSKMLPNCLILLEGKPQFVLKILI